MPDVITDLSTVKFDLNKITAKSMTKFFKANKENDYDAMAEIFTSVVSECPPSWGDPTKAETFAALPFYPVFRKLIGHLVDAMSAEAKN
jgi:hypothetical protein